MLQTQSEGDRPVVADLNFPVLGISGSAIIVYRTSDDLLTCGEDTLANGYLSRLRIIDSELREYPVLTANKVANVGLFGGWHPFYASRRVRVELALAPGRNVTLGDVQESVIAAMRKDQSFWESAGDLEEQFVEIRAIQSFSDLLWRFA